MTHHEILAEAARILKQRGQQYGNANDCFQRIATIASTILGKEVSTFEVAVIHMSTKMGRLKDNRTLADSYLDLINYTAFAAEFVKARHKVEPNGDIDRTEMAQKPAPNPKREENTREEIESNIFDGNPWNVRTVLF